MPEIRDVLPPIDLFDIYWWVWVVLAVALAVAMYFVFKKWRKLPKANIEPPQPSRPAWEIAFERLADLTARKLIDKGEFKEYYIVLSGIVRKYIEDRFDIKAPEMTTEEFLKSLQGSGVLDDAQKDILKAFLNLCDMVKFAKYGPTKQESEQSLALSYGLINATKTS